MAENLRDLQITKDELDRIGEALKKKEFRDLLVEYCEELNDPATKKQYEEEIVQLEKERGVDATFINPIPGYVIKTSIDGNKLAFINVSSNEHVDKPVSKSASQDGSRGLQWSLPHLISPPREDISKKGLKCTVYDVIFHPDTMQLTSNSNFREMVNKISCEAIESNFNIVLDKTNLKFPNLKYKGIGRPIVIRQKFSTPENVVDENETDSNVEQIYSNLYKEMDSHYDNNKYKSTQKVKSQPNQFKADYVTPKYIIKHRSDLDIQDFTYDRIKSNGAIPKELVIEINLPLLKSSADLILDVSEKSLKMVSEKPSKYKLDISLPYAIDEDSGNAKFDVDNRKLILTLPVKRNCNLLSDIGRYDSGVDSDSSPLADSPRDKCLPLIEELQSEDSAVESQCSLQSEVFRTTEKEVSNFLCPDLHYSLPEYSLHAFDNILCFTLHVKNVDADSIKKEFSESSTAIHIKFSSISSGYFPANYAFFVHLPLHQVETTDVSIEPWDNNVIVQIPYALCDTQLSTYYVGTCEESSVENLVEEPSIINSKQIENLNETSDANAKPNVQVQLNSDDELTIVVSPEKQDGHMESMSTNNIPDSAQKSCAKNINVKSRSLSESSYEELSQSHSPSRNGKSILKTRFGISRSVSESSVDDFTWSSFENCGTTSESLIPEESEDGEISSSMKKTVRFNDVVSKQVFRSNSSILGQRKKNQRKSRNKKRAYERKLSESETSEAEDKKNSKAQDTNENSKEESSQSNDKIDFKSDLIFDLDM